MIRFLHHANISFSIQVVLVNIGLGDKLIVEQTDELLSEAPEDNDYTPPERIKV